MISTIERNELESWGSSHGTKKEVIESDVESDNGLCPPRSKLPRTALDSGW